MRVEILALINDGKLKRPDDGASRKTDIKIRDVSDPARPCMHGLQAWAALLP